MRDKKNMRDISIIRDIKYMKKRKEEDEMIETE